MDNYACILELREAIERLECDNIVMTEHILSNVLIKVRAELNARVNESINLWQAEALKRMETDESGRRIQAPKIIRKLSPAGPKAKRKHWMDAFWNSEND